MSHVRRAAELILVAVAIFAALWFAAVPRFGDGCRSAANESAAIATLKNLASAQEQAIRDACRDRDHDGVFEYASFAELESARLLPRSFARLDGDGAVARSGYRFQLWLPSRDRGFVCADRPGADVDGDVDPARAAREWRAYAWPIEWRETWIPGAWDRLWGAGTKPRAVRVFAVDQSGEVHALDNIDRAYSGAATPPADAMSRAGRGSWRAVR